MATAFWYGGFGGGLYITGTSSSENVYVSRALDGTILINGGDVPISPPPPSGTVNVGFIAFYNGFGTVIIDETNGPLGRIFGVTATNVIGSSFDDTITGGGVLEGRGGDDKISGSGIIRGGEGDDTITLSGGRAIWSAGDGNDVVTGVGQNDIVEFSGGSGAEIITVAPMDATRTQLSNNNTGEHVDMQGVEEILVHADGGDDYVVGTAGATTTITANGGAGNDALIGGGGSDNLNGQAGVDILFGGLGADDFIFSASDFAIGEFDYVFDFGSGDRIVLDGWSPFAIIFQYGDHVIAASSESSFGSGFVVLDATVAEVMATLVI